jgi:hypothetical protein
LVLTSTYQRVKLHTLIGLVREACGKFSELALIGLSVRAGLIHLPANKPIAADGVLLRIALPVDGSGRRNIA